MEVRNDLLRIVRGRVVPLPRATRCWADPARPEEEQR